MTKRFRSCFVPHILLLLDVSSLIYILAHVVCSICLILFISFNSFKSMTQSPNALPSPMLPHSDGHVSNVQMSIMFSCYTKNLKSTRSRKALQGNEMCYCERLTPLMPHCQSAQQVTVQSLSALPHWWVSNYVETDRGPLCSAAHCLAVPFHTQ